MVQVMGSVPRWDGQLVKEHIFGGKCDADAAIGRRGRTANRRPTGNRLTTCDGVVQSAFHVQADTDDGPTCAQEMQRTLGAAMPRPTGLEPTRCKWSDKTTCNIRGPVR